MSVVISYISDGISIIATDTRITQHLSNGDYINTDENIKLFDSPCYKYGWFASVGNERVMDDFFYYLPKIKDEGVDKITDYYIQKCVFWINQRKDLEDDIKKSGALFHYMFNNNLIIFISNMNEQGFLGKNTFLTYFPSDYTENEKKEFVSRFSEYKYNAGDSYINVISIVIRMFEEISGKSEFVSDVCDIGLTLFNENGAIKGRIKGDINSLLNKLKDNTLEPEWIETN